MHAQCLAARAFMVALLLLQPGQRCSSLSV